MSNNGLVKLHPIHHEIMRRLMLGQSQRDIALELGRDESSLGAVIRSPLFQMEYRKLKEREMDDMMEIRKDILTAGKLGASLHRKLIEGGADGINEVIGNPIDIRIRQRSATDMLALAVKITNVKGIAPQDNDGSATYERMIEEQVVSRRITERTIENDTITGEPVEAIEGTLSSDENDAWEMVLDQARENEQEIN
jgi:hypothetical protein